MPTSKYFNTVVHSSKHNGIVAPMDASSRPLDVNAVGTSTIFQLVY